MISQRIKELRSEKDISQRSLSNQLFVSPQAISKWERDEATPNPEAISRMAEIFGVSADYLLGRTDQREKLPAEREELSSKQKEALQFIKGLSDEQLARFIKLGRAAFEEGEG